MPQPPWPNPFLLLGLVTSLSSIAHAQTPSPTLAQHCEYGSPKRYLEITTNNGDDLRIRATPGGEIIGAVPNRWIAVAVEVSPDGRWLRMTSHYGDLYPGEFMSAPHFQPGWIFKDYTKDLGSFCAKPMSFAQRVQPELLGERAIAIQPDWLALGDTLSARVR